MATKGRYANGNPITVRGVVMSFPTLKKAEAPKNHPDSKPKFSGTGLMDPVQHKAEIKAIKTEIQRLCAELWPKAPQVEMWPGFMVHKPPKMKQIICFGEASEGTGLGCSSKGEIYSGYEGKWFIAGKNAKRPTLAGKDGTILTPDEAEEILYPGSIVNASFEFTAADDQHGQGVYCLIRGVRFVRDGERFGANNAASLDELGGDDDEPDFG